MDQPIMNNQTLGNQSDVVQEARLTGQTVTACIFLVLTIIIALVGNIGVILVVMLYRHMRQDISNMLLINLSVTDCVNTCTVMLSSLISLISDEWILGRVWCDIICAVNYCLIIVSMLTLCCISLERYQAIIHPLSYRSKVKRVTLSLAICYTWVQGTIFALVPPILGWVDFDYWEAICAIQWHLYRPATVIYVITAFALCFLGPGIILCYCYIKIIKEVRQQKDHIVVGMDADKNKRRSRKMSDKSRIIWSLMVVVFAYFICTTPFSLTKLIKVSVSDTSILPGEINLSASLLGYMASAINPLIYGIFRRDFRRAYIKIIKKVFLNESLALRDEILTNLNSGGRMVNSSYEGTKNTDASNMVNDKEIASIPQQIELSTQNKNNCDIWSVQTNGNQPEQNGYSIDKEKLVHKTSKPNNNEHTQSIASKVQVKEIGTTFINENNCNDGTAILNNENSQHIEKNKLIIHAVCNFQKNGRDKGSESGLDDQISVSFNKSSSQTEFQNQDEISAESITTIIIKPCIPQ